MKTQKTCWIIADEKAGMMNQAIGLAEALEFPYEIKHIGLKWPWTILTPFIRPPYPFCQKKGTDILSAPWPDIIITCGRQSILPALWVKQQSKGRSFLIKIQNPQIAYKHFDCIITPEHDQLKGRNIITTLGSLHKITPQLLEAAKDEWKDIFLSFPKPILSVIIGGHSKHFEFTADRTRDFLMQLKKLADEKKGTLCFTLSRRTPSFVAPLIKEIMGDIVYFLYTGEGKNPYIALLAYADFIFVTADSVNMITESCITGHPVYLIPLQSKGTSKFSRFHQKLLETKMVRIFEGNCVDYTYPPLQETKSIAQKIKKDLL